MRVESVWNARIIMSNMSWMCSPNVPGMPAGVSTDGFGEVLELFGPFQPAFDFPDAGEVFIELLLIVAAELLLERAGVVKDEIEDRALLLAAQVEVLAALARRTGAEEPLEHQARIGLGRDGHRGIAPRQVELIGAGIAGIAVARLPHAVAGELQRGKPGQVADPLGRHLVDRDARVDVGAGRLPDPDARQERPARPRMVARPVQAAIGIEVVQSAQDLDLLLDLFQRLQRPGELEVFPHALWATNDPDSRRWERRHRPSATERPTAWSPAQRLSPAAAATRLGETRDSKAGRARATPTPRRKLRRESVGPCAGRHVDRSCGWSGFMASLGSQH